MTYVSVLGAFNSFMGGGWILYVIKNHLLLYPRQYDMICWELNLISGFFAFFWLVVWADGINKRGWCLAGGRGC